MRSVRGLAVAVLFGAVVGALAVTWFVGRGDALARLGGRKGEAAPRPSGAADSVNRDGGQGLIRTTNQPSESENSRGLRNSSGVAGDVRPRRNEPAPRQDVTATIVTSGHQRTWGAWITDWDCEGDLAVRAVLGGAFPGNHSFNELVQSPETHTHWLKIKLVAAKSNRLALGAKIQVELKEPDGEVLSIRRTVGNNGSFGGNSLVELIGLGAANYADQVIVNWPITRSTERFHKVDADQLIEITEGGDSYKVIEQKALPVPVPPS